MYNKLKCYKISPLLKNIFIYAFSDGITKALPFLVFPIVAYYLSAEDFGRVNNFQVLMGILAPFIGLSTNAYFGVEYYKKGKNPKMIYNQIMYFTVFLFLIVSVVVLLSIDQISKWSEVSRFWIVIALITSFFVPFNGIFLSRLRVEEKAKFFGLFNFFTVLLGSVLTILFVVLLKHNWQGRIWSIVITSILFGVISVFYGKKFIGSLKKIDLNYWKSFLWFGLPLLPHTLALWIKTAFAKIFITDSLGLAENGVYSFAISFSAIFLFFTTAFFSAFSPYIYKRLSLDGSQDKMMEIKKDIVKKIYYFLLFYLTILIVGYFVLYFIINQFFLVKYGDSLSYLPYLLGYNFFNAVYISLTMFVYYNKKTKYLGVLTIVTALLNIILLVIFIPYFGTIGAPIATFIVSIITFILIYFYSIKAFPMPWSPFKLIKI